MVLPSALGRNTSIVSILLLNSNIECDSVQPCTLAVHATSVLPFQKPTVSPNHCGTCCTCLRPISTLRSEVVGDAGEELHLVRRHHHLDRPAERRLRPTTA